MNKQIKIILLWLIFGFILMIPCVTAYSIYTTDYNSNVTGNLTIFDTITNSILKDYINQISYPQAIAINNNKIIIAQGSNTISETNIFIENGIKYIYLPSSFNNYVSITNNGIFLLNSKNNLSIFNSNTNDYLLLPVSLNTGAYNQMLCSNYDASIIAFTNGTSSTLNIIRNFSISNNSLIEYHNNNIGVGGECVIYGDILYYTNTWLDQRFPYPINEGYSQLYIINITNQSNTTSIKLFDFQYNEKTHKLKLNDDMLYIGCDKHIYYFNTKNNMSNISNLYNYSIGCNVTTPYLYTRSNPIVIFNDRSCFDVSIDNSAIAIIKNNLMYYSTNNGINFTNSNITASSVAITGSIGNTTTPLCLDNYTLCNIPQGIYCDVSNIQYCSNGCINTNMVGIITGSCNTTLCIDKCMIYGYKICSSITSFQNCGNYDTDNCLEYSGDYGCLPSNICLDGNCINNTGTGFTNNSLFTVTPYSISNNNTNYINDISLRKLLVNSKNLIHIQSFSTNSNQNLSYTSRTCDYTETNIYNQNLNIDTNGSSIIFTTLNKPTLININILPYDLINVTLYIKDSLGNIIDTALLTRNSTNKELCIYDNTSLLYCDYSVNTYDDLQNVNITYNFEFQSHTFTKTFNIKRLQPYTFSIQPQSFLNGDVSEVNITTDNTTYKSLNVNSYTQPNSFYTTLKSNYNFLQCIYQDIKCYLVRTYNNGNGISDFSNYIDYTICLSSINNQNLPDNDTDFFNNLPIQTKYWIMLISCLIIVIFMTIIMSIFGNGIAGLLVGLIMSMITSLTLTIIFNLSLLIPILYIIIGGAICAFLIRKIFTG